MAQDKGKTEVAKREEEILTFWQKNRIFEKSEEKKALKGEFVFYDGPPFATGLPHSGSLLSSIVKDVIPRYKTMQGYYVRRRWGWDCHGLPIENMVEKELGLKTKKDIEAMGVGKFNRACRDAVLRCESDWKEYIERIGRFVHFDDSYKTMDNSFMESVWWGLKEIYDKKLLYEGRKVLLYCPHCETPLAKAEIAQDNSYKDVTEEAVTVKFKVKNPEKHNLSENAYLLAWTTTPWTLPGNVALAVGEDITYIALRVQNTPELLIVASELAKVVFKDKEIEIVRDDIKGSDLVGLEYESLFEIDAIKDSKKKAHYVADADFVTTEEGTGIVHTAVMYGEDDYELGLKLDLPQVQLLSQNGHFNDLAPEFIRGEYFKKAEKAIKDDLESRGLLFSRVNYTHSYPHCHRCGTALLYNALSSWFINIQKIKKDLIKKNEKINWFPEHLKHGRFLHTLESAPDWTISRNRYWASPMPIWKNNKGDITFVGSVDELKKHTKKSGNEYYIMRHGESVLNTKNILNSDISKENPITDKGKEEARRAAEQLKDKKIDFVFYSPLQRTRETALILKEVLGLRDEQVLEEDRLREVTFGEFEGKSLDNYHSFFEYAHERLTKIPKDGETWTEIKVRTGEFLYEIEKNYKDKRVLMVSHNGVLQMLQASAHGLDVDACADHIADDSYDVKNAEVRELSFVPLPHNEKYELDLHRPYIDEIELADTQGEKLIRVPEVIDGWVESGSMPFAEYHYPFENKEVFEKRRPGDFIAEYIGQTRTWFYYLHVIANVLFNDIAFKNVITTGNILAEDGTKMSKSKKNYTNPLTLIDEFGADAFRYYLMRSVVMQAEDLRFTDDDIKEVKNRLVSILYNVFKFYALYQSEYNGSTKPYDSKNVLDQWILSRMYELRDEVTEYLDTYNTIKAARPIRDFVTDLSTWYLRRSRDRFKGGDAEDKQYALATMRFVLIELSKIIAPFMPFIADHIYRGVTLGKEKESVHLEDWPEKGKINKKILLDMNMVRELVTFALEAREREVIKVRQPLLALHVKDTSLKGKDELLELIKDEVNVKEVVFDEKIEETVILNTEITLELKEEGMAREFIRQIQNMRKNSGFTTQDEGILAVSGSSELLNVLEKFDDHIKHVALLGEITYSKESISGVDVTIGEGTVKVTLTK